MKTADDAGSAVVDFTLISLILIPLVLGIMQVGLCLHVRNTMVAAASAGAGVGAREGATLQQGAQATRQFLAGTAAQRFSPRITASRAVVGGAPVVRVNATARVPALGLFGPAVSIRVAGHAITERTP